MLQSVSSLELPYSAVNPIALSEEESSVAHSCPINYTLLSNGLADLCKQVDHVVVEGTGGWRSLMNDLRPLSEWVVQEQMVMVVGIQEGCLNHALLTAQAIASDGLPLIGWVANRINPGLAHYAEIINVLSKKNCPRRWWASCLTCRGLNSAISPTISICKWPPACWSPIACWPEPIFERSPDRANGCPACAHFPMKLLKALFTN